MKIILTGAHGTGKTTLLKALGEKLPEFKINAEMVRKNVQDKSQINKNTNLRRQNLFMSQAMLDYFSYDANDNVIFDRCPIDVLSYTNYFIQQHKGIEIDGKRVAQHYQYTCVNDWIGCLFNEPTPPIICYIPIEFDIVGDNFRDSDREFQKEIDKHVLANINMLLFDETIYTIKGSVEERVNSIIDIVNKYNQK